MEVITQIDSNKIVADSYIEYGKYVNAFRAIPSIYDGLKPVYRRLIQTAYECYTDFTKSADMVGQTLSRRHPHGDASLKEVLSSLVKMRIFDGQGNFGYKHLDGDSQEAAAMRYTEVRLNPTIRSQLAMVTPYVPTQLSYSGYKDWTYIPTPIPYSLVSGSLGIAVGIGTRIPPFTMNSLLNAYRNDNPDLLELNYDYVMTDRMGIRSLWETGKGRLSMEFHMDEVWEDQFGYLIYGRPEIFTLDMSVIDQWRSEGKVIVRDESDNIPKLFVSKVKRIRTITDEDIRNELNRIRKRSLGYVIRVCHNETVKGIGIRDWIHLTYNNYKKLIEQYKIDNLATLDTNELMWRYFHEIADHLLNKESISEISEKMNLPIEVIEMVGRKQINTLQNSDPEKEIKKINQTRSYYKNLNAEDAITEFVEEGFNGLIMET